jgi:hypothetical protein
MRKLTLLCITIFPLLLLLLGRVTTVAAQTQLAAGEGNWTQQRLPAPTHLPELAASPVYTIYLPLIVVPPPPNPKKGVGVVASPACTDLKTLNASWYFNWAVNPDSTCGPFEAKKFVPRIRDADAMSSLNQAIARAKVSGWLIGFSEPNLPWQGNLSPTQGATLWRQIETAADAAGGIKLVSPSPNQYNPGQADPYGHQWLWAMVDAYRAKYGHNPRFDAIAWNIYKRKHSDIQAYLTARRNEALAKGYNVPIWVLEYGGECWKSSDNGNTGIMKETTTWFNNTPWIGRYAWFANRLTGSQPIANWQSCSLIKPSTGLPTSLGQTYKGY